MHLCVHLRHFTLLVIRKEESHLWAPSYLSADAHLLSLWASNVSGQVAQQRGSAQAPERYGRTYDDLLTLVYCRAHC